MPKSRNRRKKLKPKKATKHNSIQAQNSWKIWVSRINSKVLWLSATGILAVAAKFMFAYFTGQVEARYLEPAGRGYEFQLTNKSSTAQVVESFRVVPDLEQEFIFKITDDIYGQFSRDGVSIPGGNTTYVPAYEFRDMDGYVISANSSTEFRIPPLVARDYMVPESVVVFLEYKTRSANSVMRWLEEFVEVIGIGGSKKRLRFLVTENYWTPIVDTQSVDALQAACRDNDMLDKTSICREN